MSPVIDGAEAVGVSRAIEFKAERVAIWEQIAFFAGLQIVLCLMLRNQNVDLCLCCST
jgi:hypothetical protein